MMNDDEISHRWYATTILMTWGESEFLVILLIKILNVEFESIKKFHKIYESIQEKMNENICRKYIYSFPLF